MDDLLADPSIAVVVNLTNPASHFEVTKASLNADKHVYSEKPLYNRTRRPSAIGYISPIEMELKAA